MSEVTSEPQDGRGVSRRQFLGQAATIGVGVAAGMGASTAAAQSVRAAGKSRTGGTFRAAMIGSGPTETVDANIFINIGDLARLNNLYAQLADDWPPRIGIRYDLAEEITPNKLGTEWTIRVIHGAEFHNGKTVGARDVIFTIERMIKNKTLVGGQLTDVASMRVLDSRTIRVVFKAPYSILAETLAQPGGGIVPVGYDPKRPVGAGPFQLVSFNKGIQTVMKRFPNYFGQPAHFDKVVLTDYYDDTARVNALLSGQADAAEQIPPAQVAQVRAASGVTLLQARGGAPHSITMRTDKPPFNDPRVRQAMRLIVNRKQLVADGLAGYGTIGNDTLASVYDPDYNTGLQQRVQDIAAAKALLKKAGHADLRLQAVTAPIDAGAVQVSEIVTEQAARAGVTIQLRTLDPQAFNSGYTTFTMAPDSYAYNPYLIAAKVFLAGTAPINPTHWHDKQYDALVARATAEMNATKRSAIVKEMQRIEWSRGGELVWGFPDAIDAVASKVQGFVPSHYGEPFDFYTFRMGWFS